MQTLTLLRHAKSGYMDGQTDFKRQLTERGRLDVLKLSNRLREREYNPTMLLVSSAVRTRETAQILREALGLKSCAITHLSDLYLASPEVLVREINNSADISHLMLIGHNPGLEALSVLLDPASPDRMSTCSLNHYELLNPANHELDAQHPEGSLPSNVEDSASSDIDPACIRVRDHQTAHFVFHERPAR